MQFDELATEHLLLGTSDQLAALHGQEDTKLYGVFKKAGPLSVRTYSTELTKLGKRSLFGSSRMAEP